ncbi:MAG: hypothetical protein GY856_06935 [bacterium]|nr:hypothetical protein [bacterium]
MSVLTEFFANEFDDYVRDRVRQELHAGRHAYFTFNIFNVRLDPEAAVATVEDVLDPDRTETVNLDEFTRMIEEAASRDH